MIRLISAVSIVILFASCGEKGNKGTPTTHNLDSLLKLYPDSVPLLIEQGTKFAEAFLMDEALDVASKAFRLDTNNIDARYLYADALNNRPNRNVSDIELAQRHFKYIVKKQPKNKKALISLATTYSQLGDFEKSFQYTNEVLRIDKKYRDAYVLKGSNYLVIGNRELAFSSYETAVQQDPEFYAGYLKLGYMYTEDLKHDLALEYYRTAAELQPKSNDALYGVAYSLQESGKYEEALVAYRHLLEVDNTYYLALYNQGFIKSEYQNQLDSAVYYYRKSVEMEPEFVKGWHNLGVAYFEQKRKPDAARAFATALKLNPDFELTKEAVKKLK
jgi:tetratricopeptide (TPR) repeat protein